MMAPRVSVRIDFGAERRLGPGKVALLEAIGATGSIAAAGRGLRMSYRRAWLLVDELNRLFEDPLVEASAGGSQGGGAALTALGRAIVAAYREVEQSAADEARDRFGALGRRPPGEHR